MRNFVSWFTFAVVLGWAGASGAACSGASPLRTAANASQAEVQACVTAATSGDTIVVPAGSATWSSAIRLPSNKDLTVKGATIVTCTGAAGASDYSCTAGATTTTLTCSPCFEVDLGASHRITGFVLTGGSGERISSTGNQNISKRFRIDHNVLISTAGWTPIRFHGGSNGIHPQGIWDHNRVQGGVAIHTNGTFDQFEDACSTCQHQIWAEDTPLGNSSKVVYVEANHFVTSTATTNFTDGNYAGRVVIRFNKTEGPSITAFEYHSPQGANRGFQRWETYNNHIVNLDAAGTCFHGMASVRGGTGVWFNNAMSGAIGGCNYSVLLDNVRSAWSSSVDGVGPCDGSSPWDQNVVGQQGWHCRDQIGVGRDLAQWSHVTRPAWNQEIKPAYFWGNSRAGSIVAVSVDSDARNRTHIGANRDFYDHSTATGSSQSDGVRVGPRANRPTSCTPGVAYWAVDEGEWNGLNGATPDGRLYKCTASNTWALYYTPYTYPHPWTTSDGPTDLESPTNLRALQ
jgi:hypothetical protein